MKIFEKSFLNKSKKPFMENEILEFGLYRPERLTRRLRRREKRSFVAWERSHKIGNFSHENLEKKTVKSRVCNTFSWFLSDSSR